MLCIVGKWESAHAKLEASITLRYVQCPSQRKISPLSRLEARSTRQLIHVVCCKMLLSHKLHTYQCTKYHLDQVCTLVDTSIESYHSHSCKHAYILHCSSHTHPHLGRDSSKVYICVYAATNHILRLWDLTTLELTEKKCLVNEVS